MERRTFLKMAGAAAGGYTLASKTLWAAQPPTSGGNADKAPLPRRVLGRTGEKVSVVVFPGYSMMQQGQEECNAAVHKAFDRGINYFDVAPAYGDSEIRLGIALQGIDRSRLFLSCKTKRRDKDGARQELERSLERLKTDHFDLYQMHLLYTPDEVTRALGPGGAIETFLKAKEEGKVRFFGFSAHTSKAALAALKAYSFDTVMFPINFVEYFQFGFGKAVMEESGRRGTAVIGMKALSGGAWPQGVERTRTWWYRPLETDEEISLALRFTLSQSGVVAAIPPSYVDVTDKAITAGQSYQLITDAEMTRLREMSTGRGSLFRRDEERVAAGHPLHESLWAGSPYGYCPHAHA